jgi:TolA-binding protein
MRIGTFISATGCGLLLLHTPVRAEIPELAAAERAMDDRLPEVAIVKLNALLRAPGALDDATRKRAEKDLTRAMLDSGDAAGALARLDFPSGPDERFRKAEALSALGQWDNAQPLYQELALSGPGDLREPAAIGESEALHAMGRDSEARAVLSQLEAPSTLARLRLAELCVEALQFDQARKLLADSKPATPIEVSWHQYVEGRIYLAEDQDAPALENFQALLDDPKSLTPALYAGAAIGLAEARIALNGLETADDVLEDFIWHHPESPFLEEMFRRLDNIYAAEESPSDSEIKHWAGQEPPRRAALAGYYLARSLQRQGRTENAIRAYTNFVQKYPGHAFAFEASMQLGQLYLDTGRIPTAITAFEGAMRYSGSDLDRARAEIATGNAYFAQGEFLLAAETFHDAAPRATDLWLQATYDSALAWLHLGNYDRFLDDYNALSARYPETEERRNLILEEGLLQARSHDPRAAATLESFIRDFPKHHRVAEAQLALAELVYADGDMASASRLLRVAYVSAPSSQSREQADYLAIFIADSSPHRQDGEVFRLGQQFLQAYPASSLRPQVRMKLGELYFRGEDYANAQTQFETLAEESPSDPLSDKALLLAGECSVRGMSTGGIEHALDLFERVAKGSGPLRLYARQEQALIEARQGHDKEAVIIYEEILRSNPDTSLRLGAQCGKADCIVASLNDPSPAAEPSPPPSPAASPAAGAPGEGFADAIALYDQIAADPDATTPWRNQALYKKGRCLGKQGLNDQALAAFYDVLNGRAAASRPEPDFFWFEKAGYDAAAMLEAKGQWPGAISILEKVAQAGGPRSAEARQRANQLRLEHFVWE